MGKVNYLSAAFESWWNWIVSGMLTIPGVITFFRPDWQPYLTWNGINRELPPIAWFIIAGIIWIVGFAINIRKRLNENERNINFPETTQVEHKKKPTWRNVKFVKWNKRFSENKTRGGIIIKNNKSDESIKDCSVEILEIFDEDGFGHYKELGSRVPATVGWEKDKIVNYC